MGVDLARLTAHLSPQQQDAVKKAYRQQATPETAPFIMCFFLGLFGGHRFYLRQTVQGLLHLALAVLIAAVVIGGIAGNVSSVLIAAVALPLLLLAVIWWIVDLVRIDGEVGARNLKLAEHLVAQTLLSDTTVEQKAQAKLDELERAAAARPVAPATPALAADPAPEAPVAGIQYAATTVTEVSEPASAAHGSEQTSPGASHDWTMTEAHTVTADEAVSEAPGLAFGGAAAAAAEFSETITHTHTESDFSVTDAQETVLRAAEPLPTPTEAEAATWPDHPPFQSEEPAREVAALAPVASDVPTIRVQSPDVTDMAEVADVQPPIADLDFAGQAPLIVPLAQDAIAAPELPETFAVLEPYYAPDSPTDESSLLLVADDGAAADVPAEVDPGIAALAFGEEATTAPSSEAFVPPTVPVVTQSAPTMPEYPPPLPVASAEPEMESVGAGESADTSGETLAELAGLAGNAMVLGGAAAFRDPTDMGVDTSVDDPPAGDAEAISHIMLTDPVQPAPEQPAPAAPTMAAAAFVAPVAEPSAPQVDEIHSDEQVQHQEEPQRMLRRIRVTRQLKVDGVVVEETSAEALIAQDADPEPVRAQLREQLRQQALERMNPGPGAE
jgi:hypothetical protein